MSSEQLRFAKKYVGLDRIARYLGTTSAQLLLRKEIGRDGVSGIDGFPLYRDGATWRMRRDNVQSLKRRAMKGTTTHGA